MRNVQIRRVLVRSIVSALAAVLSAMLAIEVFAEPANDISDYFPRVANAGEDGSAEKPYTIANFAALDALRLAVDDGIPMSGVHFRQTADIDMSEELPFAGIGVYQPMTNGVPFTGIYDGAGHKILNVDMTQRNYGGIFNQVNGGTIRNLTVSNITCRTYSAENGEGEWGGAIVGHAMSGTILQNLVAEGEFGSAENPCTHNVGGIVVRVTPSEADILVKDCTNNAALYGVYTKMSGICVLTISGSFMTTFDGCVNNGKLTMPSGERAGIDGLAGIVAFVYAPTSLVDCRNYGKMSSVLETAAIGELVGKHQGTDLIDNGGNEGYADKAMIGIDNSPSRVFGFTDIVVSDNRARTVKPSGVDEISFRQRYPWNGLVDIDCTVDGDDPNADGIIHVCAKDEATGKDLVVESIWLEGDATHTNALVVKSGSSRLVWDAGADNPNLVSDAVRLYGFGTISNRFATSVGRLDLRRGTRVANGAERIAYSPRWGNADNCTVNERVPSNMAQSLVDAATEEGELEWTPAGTGAHVLTHMAGNEVYTTQFTVLGDDVVTHAGTISANETWSSDKVHLVTSALQISAGVSLLIEPGAVVKFMPGMSLGVTDGATCIAQGVVFTHVNDDMHGGDVLCDGDETVPEHGAYAITGEILDDENTHYKYIDRIALRITNVVCRQRYPWNGLVDIDFTVKCGVPTNINIYVSAKDEATSKALSMRSVWLENDSTHTNALVMQCGKHRLVWDAGADNPGLVSDAVKVEIQAYVGESPLYMVIDLSGGKDAASYPVSYLADVPQGGWTDDYKTTKLVLRWIPVGTFTMGGRATDYPGASDNGLHQVTLTMPFYVGIFPVTQKQYELVTGNKPSSYKGDARPVEYVSWNTIRGNSSTYNWPSSSDVDASTFMGKVRTKTGMKGFDLPTEAQWEYACRAGTTTALNSGKNLTSTSRDANIDEVGRHYYNQNDGKGGYTSGHTTVGSYLPNAWGIYDMHGSVWEWVLDWYQSNLGTAPMIDPLGPSSGTTRVVRGGSWMGGRADYCISSSRWSYNPTGYSNGDFGFRLCYSGIQGVDAGGSTRSATAQIDLRTGIRLISGFEKVTYSPCWGNAKSCMVTANGEVVKTASDEGVFEWTPQGTGSHTLTHTAGDLFYTAQFTVLGDDVVTHAGTISTNEIWSADKVHLVTADVTVPSGVSLLIEPGAVVKFMPGTSLIVANGATGTAVGVLFTHANDDTLQGDTLFDGETAPVQDDYKIVGNVIDDDTTDYRYMAPQQLTSSITSNIRLRGHRVYVVSNDVTVASGATLTIQPGAILKFASSKSLIVNSGGTLNAQGTRALPIVFTSLKDDSVGGDTNGDGDSSVPAPNDWRSVKVSGIANFDNVKMLYGGGVANSSDSGMLVGNNGGKITLANCVLAHGMYDAIFTYAQITAENCALYDCDRGVDAVGGSITMKNCVVDKCRWGVMAEGGAGRFYNCSITRFYGSPSWPTGYGVSLWSGGSLTVRNCNVWTDSASGQNWLRFSGTSCISSDPRFVFAENGDFRLQADSPCVDAGDPAYAPKTDYFGQKRVTVYEREGYGDGGRGATAIPDIGIHEVMPREVKSDVDLAVESVVAPESFTVGEKITVTWNVKNVGSETASGTWSDKVELVCANGSAVELGTVATNATMPADGVQTFSGTFTVPSAQVGAVRVRVTANANRDIFEGTLTANNSAESEVAALTMPQLAFPGSGVASFNVAAGGSAGYRLGDGFADGGLLIVHVASATAGGVKVWTGNGQVPTADIFYAAAVEVGGGDYLVRVPAGGDAYVSFANEGSGLAKVDVGTETGAFLLFDTGVVTAPNEGVVSLTLYGNGFEEGMEAWITNGRDGARPSQVVVFDSVKAVATFDVTGLAAGAYEVHVKKGGVEDAASLLALTQQKVGPKWSCKLDIASAVRSSREYVGYLEYSNSGDMPLDAPYVKITAGSGSFIRFGTADAWGDTLELMATSETYPASQLKPGETRRIPFRYKTTVSSLSVECGYTQDDPSAFPWDTNASYMRPSWASDELWGLSLAVLKSNVGATWNDYLARMRANCDHLAKIGQPTHRLDRIWQLEINEALGVDHAVSTLASNTDLARSGRGFGLALSRSYGSGLYRRLRKGVFGYGWSDNYSAYAELQNSGTTLALHSGSGSTYLFEKVNGKWTPEDARDKTTCTETSTEYVLTYRSGTVQRIAKSNMRVSSVRDNQGNTLSFTYNAAKQLVKVEHCDGQSLSFTYAGGLLVAATDDQGRTTRYEYSGDLLVKVTAFNGLQTQYRYLPADGSVTSRALRQIAYADGTTRDYTYDSAGRVATVAINGNRQTVEIVRKALGSYIVVAPNGGETQVTLGASGEVRETVNALGQKSARTYTADTLLESVVGPTGKRAKIAYDEDGQAVKATDAAGANTYFGYTSDFGNLAKVTDARGNSFDYGYDKKGRSKSISYADGSIESIAYNDRGDVTNSVNRRGQSITFTYDREGNTLSKVWENGRTFIWAYDAKGNCTNATDSATGTVTMEYDENERLTRIVHPKGRGFAYTYDSLGRTISRTTLGGTGSVPSAADIQRYEYDSLGRLSRMTDGDGNLYVENAYDSVTGWLITQTYGNGTIVSNAYDILGRTIGIYHGRARTPAAPLEMLAFFKYAYDAEGRRISQTTAEGTERYTYDTVGQLTDVIYPDGSEEHFTYDAVGNRITSGRAASPLAAAATTTYTANNLNQYTTISGGPTSVSAIEYDLDGNMTRKGDTHYYYDIQNRLVAVTNTTTDIAWSCEYDVFGNRTKVIDHGTAKETLFVQGSLASAVAEFDGEGAVATRHILLGSVRIADWESRHLGGGDENTIRYYHADGLASTRLLTDANGDTIGTVSYRAFGSIRTTGGSRPVATDAPSAGWVGTLGVERDDATGLIFMRNRYYDAEQGRFIQMDPIGLNGRSHNFYQYCDNNPISRIDVTGYIAIADDVTILCLAGVVVAGTYTISVVNQMVDWNSVSEGIYRMSKQAGENFEYNRKMMVYYFQIGFNSGMSGGTGNGGNNGGWRPPNENWIEAARRVVVTYVGEKTGEIGLRLLEYGREATRRLQESGLIEKCIEHFETWM